MGLANYLKIVRVLHQSEKIKSQLSYCRSARNCQCMNGEMCQRALSRATGLTDNAIKNMILRLEMYREELGEYFPFEIRNIAEGGNFPRKFIKLRD